MGTFYRTKPVKPAAYRVQAYRPNGADIGAFDQGGQTFASWADCNSTRDAEGAVADMRIRVRWALGFTPELRVTFYDGRDVSAWFNV